MKFLTTVLLLIGCLLCALFIGLAFVVKWLLRPACVFAVCWVVWHFTTKYW